MTVEDENADRPLRWVKGIGRQDPREVGRELESLLREGPAVLIETQRLCLEALTALTARSDMSGADESTVVLSGMFVDASEAAGTLLALGYCKAACSQVRAMIETRVVVEYLRKDPQQADMWRIAKSSKERRAFSFESVYLSVENSDFWKQWWDELNGVVHSNRGAAPAQYRLRPILGIDMYVGSFFEPIVASRLFLETLALTQWYCRLLLEWYEKNLADSLKVQYEAIVGSYAAYANDLLARASADWRRVRQKPGTITVEEQRRAAVALGLPPEHNQDSEQVEDPFDLPIFPEGYQHAP